MTIRELPEPVPVQARIRVDDHEEWLPALAHALRRTASGGVEVLVDPDSPHYNEQWVPRGRVRPVVTPDDST